MADPTGTNLTAAEVDTLDRESGAAYALLPAHRLRQLREDIGDVQSTYQAVDFNLSAGPDLDATLRITEGSATNFQGGYVKHKGAANTVAIGVHSAADSDASSDADAITIDRATGDVTIANNLTIGGTTTTVNSTTLTVDDINIELAHSPSGSALDDAGVDGGGITLKSSDGDKTILFDNANDFWAFNQGVSATQSNVSSWAFRGTGARLGAQIDVGRTNSADVVLRLGDSTTIDLFELYGATGGAEFKTDLTITADRSSQLVVGYDASNKTTFTTNSGGDMTVAPSGGELTLQANTILTGALVYGNESKTADGAISPLTTVTLLDSSSATTQMTLANATDVGTIKFVICTAYSNTADVDATMTSASGSSSTFTFSAAGGMISLMWTGSAWQVLGHAGGTLS